MIEYNSQRFDLDKLRKGDREEFARLVEVFSSSIYRLGLKMLGNPQDAEDALQNTFLQALRHIQNFEGRSSLSTWLYRIAANEALMMLRRKQPEMTLSEMTAEENEEEPELPSQFVDWCCLPEEELLSAESSQYLNAAIQNLPPTLRVVFLLRDIEGLSIQETSQALGLTPTAVKARLLRARLHLREQLSIYYGERLKARNNGTKTPTV